MCIYLDCWSIVQVAPTVIDAALGSESELKLELSKPPSEKVDIICSATLGQLILVIINNAPLFSCHNKENTKQLLLKVYSTII